MPSYVFEGPTWPAGPITWSFAASTYFQDLFSQPFSSFVPAAYQATVAQAVQRWADVSELTLQQVPDTPTVFGAPDIRIGFGRLGTATTLHVGITNYYRGAHFAPDVTIRLEDPAEFPVTTPAGQPTYGTTGVTLYQVALHEFGHALGLGHSSSPGDVMYSVLSDNNRDLSLSDIAGIRALYPPAPVVLHGPHTDYVIAQVSGGQAYVQDLQPGRDGVQTLSHPGALRFTDGSGLFDPTGTAEDVTRLYQAAFNRAPDLPGLENNTALVTSGTLGLRSLAASFADSAEFQALYGRPDTPGFVQQLYLNVLHRPPDAAGQQQWSRFVDATSRADALLAFSDSQENHRQTLGIAGDRDDAEVTRLYQAAFSRAPDADNFPFMATRL